MKHEQTTFRLAIATRWKDNDIYGHVNNVEYYSFFDTVVNTWLIREAGLDIHDGEIIGLCVSSQCEFSAPLAFPETVTAELRVLRLGNSSVTYGIRLFAEAQPEKAAAEGQFTHVFVAREDRRPRPLPTSMREAMQRLLSEGESP